MDSQLIPASAVSVVVQLYFAYRISVFSDSSLLPIGIVLVCRSFQPTDGELMYGSLDIAAAGRFCVR